MLRAGCSQTKGLHSIVRRVVVPAACNAGRRRPGAARWMQSGGRWIGTRRSTVLCALPFKSLAFKGLEVPGFFVGKPRAEPAQLLETSGVHASRLKSALLTPTRTAGAFCVHVPRLDTPVRVQHATPAQNPPLDQNAGAAPLGAAPSAGRLQRCSPAADTAPAQPGRNLLQQRERNQQPSIGGRAAASRAQGRCRRDKLRVHRPGRRVQHRWAPPFHTRPRGPPPAAAGHSPVGLPLLLLGHQHGRDQRRSWLSNRATPSSPP
jgi:hypothetical protein